MPFEVRAMTTEDYPEASLLWQTTKHIGLSSADSNEAIAVFLQRNPDLSAVALAEGRLVGTVLCGSDGRRGYIYNVAVAESQRGQGIGQAMVEFCLAALKDAGIEKCHLFVFADNAGGKAFWARTGWKFRDELLLMSRSL